MKTIIIASLVCLIVGSAMAAPFTEILRMDCSGELVLFPDIIGLRAAIPTTFFTDIVDEIYGRFDCMCDEAFDKNEFLYRFVPSLGPVLSQLETGEAFPASMMTTCPDFTSYMNLTMLPNMTLPNTCTFQQWATNAGCTMKVGVPQLLAEIALATKQCSNFLPYVSVTCLGEDCNKLLYPCQTDADCNANGATSVCFDPIELPGMFDAEVRNWTVVNNYLNLLLAKGGFVNMPSYSFCPAESIGTPTDLLCDIAYVATGSNPGYNTGILSLLNYFRVLFGGQAQTKEKLFKVCIPDVENIMSNVTLPDNITINAWDGQINGASVFADARVNPVLPQPTLVVNTTANIVPLFEFGCDGNVYILPKHPLQVTVGINKLPNHINAMFNAIKEIETCRATTYGKTFGAGELNLHYILSDPSFLLYYLSTAAGEFQSEQSHLGSVITASDLLTKLFNNRPGSYKVVLPNGCTKADFMAHKCSFSFIGLNNFTGISNVLRVKYEECPNTPYSLPHITIDCQGEGCELVTAPKPCDVAGAMGGACPAGTVCTDFSFLFTNGSDMLDNPFRELFGLNEVCGSVEVWNTFVSKMIHNHFNTEVPLTKTDYLYCLFDMSVQPPPYMPATKDVTTQTSTIYGIIPYCDETLGTCNTNGGDGSDGTSAASALIPSMITLVIGLFLTGRRSLALVAAVLVLSTSVNGYYFYNVENLNPTNIGYLNDTNIALDSVLHLDLAFEVSSGIPSGWCNNFQVEAWLIEPDQPWCDYCNNNRPRRLTFKPHTDMCTTVYSAYNSSYPFTVYAEFLSRTTCLPQETGVYRLNFKTPCGYGSCEEGVNFNDPYNHPVVIVYGDLDTNTPALVGYMQMNATNGVVDVSASSKAVTFTIVASDSENKVEQVDLRFSTCKFFENDEAQDGDNCERYWFNSIQYSEERVGQQTTFTMTYEIPQGFPAMTLYIMANVSDGCNHLLLHPCKLVSSGDAKLVIQDYNPDTVKPHVNNFYFTPNTVMGGDGYSHNVTVHYDIIDDRKMRWAKVEICKNGEDGNCRGIEINPWDTSRGRKDPAFTDSHWIGEIDVQVDGLNCGQWYTRRLEMNDNALNNVRIDLCSRYQSRDNLPVSHQSFVYYTPGCYYDNNDDYCSGNPFDFFSMLMDDREFDPTLL